MLQKKKKNTKHLGEILPPPLRKQLQGKVTSAKSSMGSLWLGLLPAYAPPLCTPRRPPRHPPTSSPLSLPTLGLTDLQGPAPAQIPWTSGFFFWGGGRAPSVTAKIRPSAIVNSPAMPQPPSKRTRSPPGRSGWGPAGPNRRRELVGAGGSGRQLDASGESLCLCIKGAETSGPTLSCSPEQRRVLWMRQLACSRAAAETPRVEGPLENRTHSSGRLGVLQNEPELFRKPNHFSF